MDRKREYLGYGLAAVSAVTFSAKGVLAKVLYGYGVDPVTLLALRFLMALPFFWVMVLAYPSKERTSIRDVAMLVLSGLVGLYAAALADFYGLLYIDASLERVVLYTYPAIVIVLSSMFFKERLDGVKIFALALTYAGLALALKLYSGVMEGTFIGAGLVLFSALVYSFSYIITQLLGVRVSGVKISAYTVTAATAAFAATWHGSRLPAGANAWLILGVIAVFSTFIPTLAIALSIRMIGAGRAATVGFIGPLSTALLAYLTLGETMDTLQITGMVIVMAGVLIISSRSTGKIKT